MKSVSPDAFFPPLIRTGINCGVERHAAMKAGVKYGHLGNRTDEFPDDLDTFELCPVVQRREFRRSRDSGFHIWRDKRRLSVCGAAMDDSMPSHINLRARRQHALVTAPQALEQMLHRLRS